MIGKVLNLPFKVLGGVARAVQAQDAKKRSHAGADERAENAVTQGIDIRVPDDFDAGPIHLPAATAVTLTDSGCIIDATVAGAGIPNALHIPAGEIGIRIAELPPDTTIVVITTSPATLVIMHSFFAMRGIHESSAPPPVSSSVFPVSPLAFAAALSFDQDGR